MGPRSNTPPPCTPTHALTPPPAACAPTDPACISKANKPVMTKSFWTFGPRITDDWLKYRLLSKARGYSK